MTKQDCSITFFINLLQFCVKIFTSVVNTSTPLMLLYNQA